MNTNRNSDAVDVNVDATNKFISSLYKNGQTSLVVFILKTKGRNALSVRYFFTSRGICKLALMSDIETQHLTARSIFIRILLPQAP